jgi:hypothetical protein
MPTVPGRRKGRLHERGKLITGPPSTPPVPNLIDLHVLMLPSDGAEPRIIQQLKREPVNLVVCPRNLPRQADSSKVELLASW